MRRQLGFGRQAVLAAGALVLGGLLFDGATASAQQFNRQPQGANRQGANQNRAPGGQNRQGQGGGNRDEQEEVKLPDDPKLLELHRNFVLAAEKLAGDYERSNQIDKAIDCYSEILRLVPTYSPAADKLGKIKEKEATAEKKLVDVFANKGWQDAGIAVAAGKPLTIRANGQWTLKMTYNLEADGLEIPKELRDFPLGAMIGVIAATPDADDAKPFLVGRELKLEPKQDGRLYLRIYDSDTNDNLGRIAVMVEGTFKK
ncbi:MAG: hypothetical protein JNL96_07285 [Planctomycetaceae bacterium]|nr:hypothetical protein [Planctomycetaceae bacterium]